MKFSSKQYWENRYDNKGNSGNGSYGKLCEFKKNVINSLIETYNLKSCVEYGCGDGNQLKYFNFEQYIGLDISKSIINQCKKNYKEDTNKEFYLLSDFDKLDFNKYDCSLSLDVIYHLIEDDIYNNYVSDLFDRSNKLVIIYTFGKRSTNIKFPPHVKPRDINLTTNIFENWELIKFITNEYPSDSYSDFYIYINKNLKDNE